MKRLKFDLQFSDHDMGLPQFGFMVRPTLSGDAETVGEIEDSRYLKFVKGHCPELVGHRNPSVVGGCLYLDEE